MRRSNSTERERSSSVSSIRIGVRIAMPAYDHNARAWQLFDKTAPAARHRLITYLWGAVLRLRRTGLSYLAQTLGQLLLPKAQKAPLIWT